LHCDAASRFYPAIDVCVPACNEPLNKEKTRREYSYRDMEAILAKFIISPEAIQCLRYSDLALLVQCCLESDDVNLRELALETVDSFIELAYGVDRVRIERRLPAW